MNKNDVWLDLTCDISFITYYMLKKIKLSFRSLRETEKHLHQRHSQILKWPFRSHQIKFDTRHLLKYNAQLDQSNQIITVYLIGQFNSELLLYDIFSLQ